MSLWLNVCAHALKSIQAGAAPARYYLCWSFLKHLRNKVTILGNRFCRDPSMPPFRAEG